MASATSASSWPWAASIALLAVTTCLPAAIAARTAASAMPPVPPISSTKTSIAGIARQRHRIVEPAKARCSTPRPCRSRAETPVTRSGRPQRSARFVAVPLDQPQQRRADRAEAGKAQPQRHVIGLTVPSSRLSDGRRPSGRRCATFYPRFQGSGGGCGRPGGCAARSRRARSGRSRRHTRRSRCRGRRRGPPSR